MEAFNSFIPLVHCKSCEFSNERFDQGESNKCQTCEFKSLMTAGKVAENFSEEISADSQKQAIEPSTRKLASV